MMNDLVGKFDMLGFDLSGLDDLIYLSGDPTQPPPPDCAQHCWKCSVSCVTCGAGCSTGPAK